ncbi:YfiT family bacillithiol transferase [Olivibacter sitiensis]|uniref:YfiT family bacillithiol transferase n=1 Tax=Olivibacter sitiensis TaxID=376470 RepID=UPI0003F7753F|nr:putative metal-dependent hydrolase [Olivibacter sitiensis]
MTNNELTKLQYPIGQYVGPITFSPTIIDGYIDIISDFPHHLRKETGHLSDSQLDTEYRPQGWTIRQLVHHCADSHLNAYTRFKLALTEEKPTIKPYREDKWAELIDGKSLPIAYSLSLLESLHFRWITLLKALTVEELKRTFIHPENGKEITLEENIGIYAWHCEHHLAHIIKLKERMNWK